VVEGELTDEQAVVTEYRSQRYQRDSTHGDDVYVLGDVVPAETYEPGGVGRGLPGTLRDLFVGGEIRVQSAASRSR